jgi:tetratricopeptide (TPR) repeat protein
MIYPETRSDYFTKSLNSTEFETQFDILIDDNFYVAATEEGLVRLSLLEKIGQIFRGLLGGVDNSEEHRLQAAKMKILYYGEAQEFLNHEQRICLRNRACYDSKGLDPTIVRLFKEIGDHPMNCDKEEKSDHLNRLREMIEDYHRRHTTYLKPGLWSRLVTPPFLEAKKLIFFGDTPLELSSRALKSEKPDPYLSFHYLLNAFDIKNNSPKFQIKLAEQLQNLEDFYRPELQDQQRKIQELWIKLAETAYENGQPVPAQDYLERALLSDNSNAKNRLLIGKLYLMNQEYRLARPFLSELEKAFAQDIQVQIEIGNAYWHDNKFQEAFSVYETTLKYSQNNAQKLLSHQKQIAFIYHQLGIIFSQNLISVSPGNLTKAIEHFDKAVKVDSSEKEYLEDLCNAYILQWEAFPLNFAADYGLEWIQFLKICPPTMIEKLSDKMIKMLFECSEQFFKIHQNQKAHICLETIFQLFPSRLDLKIDALDLAIRFQDWMPLESKFDKWNKECYTNPYLKKKMGDAYWNTRQDLAVAAYQQSLDLLTQSLQHCQDDEILVCQHHMAELQAKIGQHQIQAAPGLFKSVPYDEALKRLEEATSLDPLHAPIFFDACLSAAQAEKQRSKLLRDTNKMISYLQKAFQIQLKKGDYLIELMQLYLSSKRFDEAINLYYDIQKQPWSKELVFPAKVISELADKLFERKNYEAAIACLKEAYKQEPTNLKYKHDYFQLTLTFAKHLEEAYQKDKAKEEEKKRLEQLLKIVEILTECWGKGFQNVDKLKPPFQNMLIKIHRLLADCFIERCLLPQLAEKMDKNDVREHKKKHEKNITQAIAYYDVGLSYQPENGSLHFDKGLLLDWQGQYEEAFKEHLLAIKDQPYKPFYHQLLAPLYYIVHTDSTKKEDHMKLAESCASPAFKEDYPIWKAEFMSQAKTKEIDPHTDTYTQKRGWF